ncbi:hypothetical protein [Paracoccus sp. (in: a-proteobacteria)]|uniref:hypothetical protein n=1 Tax=Paracoccus sp. TaxID=267 RepID=UPI0026DF4904|nr:hypothetical protein [Paracoccus sp. (in: a-proteobacteria)]MDO5646976.1 hypothetical protein [Paracoccus sp. (in: a-proteobacteria)]
MNMNQIINMFTRLVMRRAMNWGITKGLQTMSRGKSDQPQTPAQKKQTREMAQRMRNLNRMNRR